MTGQVPYRPVVSCPLVMHQFSTRRPHRLAITSGCTLQPSCSLRVRSQVVALKRLSRPHPCAIACVPTQELLEKLQDREEKLRVLEDQVRPIGVIVRVEDQVEL